MKKHVKNFLKFYNLIEADRLMCWNCGEKEAVDHHHIVFASQGGSDEADNIIPLCRGVNCHNTAHSGLKEQEDRFKQIVALKMKEMQDNGYLAETFNPC